MHRLHTRTLEERVQRARTVVSGPADLTAGYPAPASPPGSTPGARAGAWGRGPVHAMASSPQTRWWQQQHDSVSKLDSLLTDLGLPSPHRGSLAARQEGRAGSALRAGRAAADADVSWASERGRSGDSGARVSFVHDDTDALLNTSLLTAALSPAHRSGDRSKSPLRGGDAASPGRGVASAQPAAAQGMSMLGGAAHGATGLERTLQRRLDVLQAHNEKMVQQTEDLVQTVNMYQAESRQLKEELGQRDVWIQETIRQLNQPDTVVPIEAQREGLRRWLQKVVKEAAQREKAAPTVMDLRKAQEIADEMKIREREVRSRLVLEVQKSQAAQQVASEAQRALQDSDHRAALTEAEVSLLRQQLQQALLSHQQVADELAKSRVQVRSMEGRTEVLEERLDKALLSLRVKDEEMHSLHTDYSRRLVQIQELRKEKASLESQVQRVSGSLKYVVDDLRGSADFRSAGASKSRQRESNVSVSRAARRRVSSPYGHGSPGSPLRNGDVCEDEAEGVRRWKQVSEEQSAFDRTWEMDATGRRPVERRSTHSAERSSVARGASRLNDLQASKQDEVSNHGREHGPRECESMEGSDDCSGSHRRTQRLEEGEQESGEETHMPLGRRESPLTSKVQALIVSRSSQTTWHGGESQDPAGKERRSIEVQGGAAAEGSDAEQWLAMEEFDMREGKTRPENGNEASAGGGAHADVGGDSLLASSMLAPVGKEGPWRNPRVLWDDMASSAPIDLNQLHANGKEISGYALRRALKALAKGNSTTLSAVDSQVQRQLLLGVSSQGINNCSIFDLPLHSTVIKQGQNSRFMLVVLEGRIKVWRSRNASSGRNATLRASASQSGDPVRGAVDTHSGTPGDTDTVLTECVAEVTDGDVLLEVEAALGVPCPYTAMVARCSGGGGEGGRRGAKDKGRDTQRTCQVLSITGIALTSLMDLYPSLLLPERLSLARKAFPYPGRSLGLPSDSSFLDWPRSCCQRGDEADMAAGSFGARGADGKQMEGTMQESAELGGGLEDEDVICRSRLVASDLSDGYYTPPAELRDEHDA